MIIFYSRQVTDHDARLDILCQNLKWNSNNDSVRATWNTGWHSSSMYFSPEIPEHAPKTPARPRILRICWICNQLLGITSYLPKRVIWVSECGSVLRVHRPNRIDIGTPITLIQNSQTWDKIGNVARVMGTFSNWWRFFKAEHICVLWVWSWWWFRISAQFASVRF